jgi:hypothetical protein
MERCGEKGLRGGAAHDAAFAASDAGNAKAAEHRPTFVTTMSRKGQMAGCGMLDDDFGCRAWNRRGTADPPTHEISDDEVIR